MIKSDAFWRSVIAGMYISCQSECFEEVRACVNYRSVLMLIV